MRAMRRELNELRAAANAGKLSPDAVLVGWVVALLTEIVRLRWLGDECRNHDGPACAAMFRRILGGADADAVSKFASYCLAVAAGEPPDQRIHWAILGTVPPNVLRRYAGDAVANLATAGREPPHRLAELLAPLSAGLPVEQVI